MTTNDTAQTWNGETVTLTPLEAVVYRALVDDAESSTGGDFSCAEEINTKALKLTRAQFGALLTTLQTKRVISVDVTFINQSFRVRGQRITQVTFPRGGDL